MGAQLGSDVPFFTRASCAVVRGRGDVVEPIQGRDDLWAVIVDPLFGVSTKEAYRLFDEGLGGEDRGFELASSDLERRYGADPGEWGFFNSFFPLIAGMRPELGRIRTELAEDGALYSNMSGSGSSMFGIFGAEEAARAAAERQRRNGLVAHQGFLLARNDNIILK
jgi:4-diphosphocytidyl-2-C-methyl-D-erythritol kinase